MAQFTPHGRMKLLFNGDGGARKSYGIDSSKEQPLHSTTTATTKLRSVQLHKRSRLGLLIGSSATSKLYSSRSTSSVSSSSSSNRSRYRRKDDSRRKVKDEEFSYDENDEDEDDDDNGGSGFENEDDLACFRGLVLDISYRPVNVVCWRRAICLEFTEKADVLEYYDQTVNSPSGSFYIPAVLRVPHLLQVVKRRRIRTNLSRKNILYRDNYTCQYCSSRENLTIDHVLPIARGGEWTWENLVTACSKCNSRKGQKTPEEANMKLLKIPKAPKDYDILTIPLTSAAIRMLRMRNGTPEEWRQYLATPSSEP